MGFNARCCPQEKSFESPTDVLLCADIYKNVVWVQLIRLDQSDR